MSVEKKQLPFPYEFYELDPALNEEMKKDFRAHRAGFIQIGPDKWFFNKEYESEASKIYNFEVRPSDVWIVTYPRSGTTWTQQMVWTIANDLDFESASNVPLNQRFPFLEYYSTVSQDVLEDVKKELSDFPEKQKQLEQFALNTLEIIDTWQGKRFIKSHLPLSLLPPDLTTKGCKVIYVARNPLDVAVSYFYLYRSVRVTGDFIGSFEKFWEYFKKDQMVWSPYWTHIKEGWEHRHEKNFLFLFYEDMNKDLRTGIKTVADFLEKPLTSQQIDKLEDYLKFENFKNIKSVSTNFFKELKIFHKTATDFVRKGKTGAWRDYFSEEEAEEAEKWVKKNQEAIGIKFQF